MKTRRVYRFLCHPASNVEGDKVLSIDWRGRAWLVKREMIALQVSPSLTTPSLRVASSRLSPGNRQAMKIFRLLGLCECWTAVSATGGHSTMCPQGATLLLHYMTQRKKYPRVLSLSLDRRPIEQSVELLIRLQLQPINLLQSCGLFYENLNLKTLLAILCARPCQVLCQVKQTIVL